MRLATIRTSDGTIAARVEDPDRLLITPLPEYPDVKALLREDKWRDIAANADSQPLKINKTDLAPVIPHPDKIICVGLNYANHIQEMGHDLPDVPTLFIKFAEALAGPYDEISIAPWAQSTIDWEGELAVIIAKDARRVREHNAADYIAGYAVINDATNREFQNRTLQWHQGKSLESSAGFGPWLTTTDSWSPGGQLHTFLNETEMQSAATDDLVFSPEKLVEFISHLYPLRAGDVIATGTPGGVGHARSPQRYIAHNDQLRITIDGLGEIAHRFCFEKA
ncbi:2-hydroxyhepta-2,4-diene-1,7-dioate isomerase [Corynebacterium poyangense]|uniref:2-hydroxyhepta-2,4-diene-1,7-dioate isomerase n=1 Tax=Corynebacterium poyangense TaxID=2684405 RepID=A0A7H0SMZ6_9CORY|nr:fumarylacetoacetate hydrolase family protein [Corynebacterium poyangense]MBZ8176243.1 2-hydroxyhepta-2,4-diene-1,7-dioate isomerase [Corynebacterium poyangense]QNQ89921.1 2-hydroxyhepta-2,4-diene-1,7-dioate isomerase [Corynebacterium poyangense]